MRIGRCGVKDERKGFPLRHGMYEKRYTVMSSKQMEIFITKKLQQRSLEEERQGGGWSFQEQMGMKEKMLTGNAKGTETNGQ